MFGKSDICAMWSAHIINLMPCNFKISIQHFIFFEKDLLSGIHINVLYSYDINNSSKIFRIYRMDLWICTSDGEDHSYPFFELPILFDHGGDICAHPNGMPKLYSVHNYDQISNRKHITDHYQNEISWNELNDKHIYEIDFTCTRYKLQFLQKDWDWDDID